MSDPSLAAQFRFMNSELHQYPAALYSAVSEIGYRSERFTGEVLRSTGGLPRGAHRRPRLSQLRLRLTGASRHSTPQATSRGASWAHHRRQVVQRAPQVHAR
jgi:hypothetical protein